MSLRDRGGATFARSWNFRNFTHWGEMGTSFPKLRKNQYTVIHHYDGRGRPETIIRQNISFITLIIMAAKNKNG